MIRNTYIEFKHLYWNCWPFLDNSVHFMCVKKSHKFNKSEEQYKKTQVPFTQSPVQKMNKSMKFKRFQNKILVHVTINHIFVHFIGSKVAVVPEPGGHCPPPPQYLADQLTLFQSGRADYPNLLPLAPPMFFTFRHH